jgi:hypothetical protein
MEICDYTRCNGFTVQNSTAQYGIRGPENCLIENCGVQKMTNTTSEESSYLVGIYLESGTVRNCVVNYLTAQYHNVDSESNSEVDGIVVVTGAAFNNFVSYLTSTNTSVVEGSTSTAWGIVSGSGYIYNNVIIELAATGYEPTTRAIVAVSESVTSDYNAYDDTTIVVPVGDNDVLVTPSVEFIRPNKAALNPNLTRNSTITEAGFDLTSLTNTQSIDSVIFAQAVNFTTDINGTDRGDVWAIGVDNTIGSGSNNVIIHKGLSQDEGGIDCRHQESESTVITRLTWVYSNGGWVPAPAVCTTRSLRATFED